MKFFITAMMSVVLLCPYAADAQSLDEKKIIKRANEIMHNIYMDIWRIRDGYKELAKFGPENVSETPELPYQYQSIKCIRFRRDERQGEYLRKGLPSSVDNVYIGFSGGRHAVGNYTEPTYGIYVEELRLFLLVYSKIDNRFFEHAIVKIVKKNASKPPEEEE